MAIEDILLEAHISPLAGVDEAGRGACAGPLVVAAVILREASSPQISRIKDSKEIGESERESLFDVVIEHALAFSIIEISPTEIDERGVHAANIDGMRRAVQGLSVIPKYVLTDGYAVPGLAIPSLGVWKGDQVVRCISAASILAKVARDRILRAYEDEYPHYGFGKHKGYSTLQHMNAIKEMGVTKIHRRSFANIASIINIKG